MLNLYARREEWANQSTHHSVRLNTCPHCAQRRYNNPTLRIRQIIKLRAKLQFTPTKFKLDSIWRQSATIFRTNFFCDLTMSIIVIQCKVNKSTCWGCVGFSRDIRRQFYALCNSSNFCSSLRVHLSQVNFIALQTITQYQVIPSS